MQITDEDLQGVGLDQLQISQWRHDQKCHQDVVVLDLKSKLTHFALHQAKYAGRLFEAWRNRRDDIFESILLDSLIIGLASANALGVRLKDSVLIEWNSSGFKADDIESVIERIMIDVGGIAKAMEALDHIEKYDSRGELETHTKGLVKAVLQFFVKRERDISSLVRARWGQIESKNMILELSATEGAMARTNVAELSELPLFLRVAK